MSGLETMTTSVAGRGRVVGRGAGELYVVPDNRIELKGYGVYEFQTVPGSVLPPHIHDNDDELHYLIEGDAVYTIGEETLEADAGSLIFLPKQVVHAVTFGRSGGRWLWITSLVNEGIARELGIPADETTPLPAEEDWDWDRMFQVFAKYGMEFLEPEG